jgi:hypothetical protein
VAAHLTRLANARESLGTLGVLWRLHGVPPHRAIADFRRFRRLIDCARVDFLMSHLWDRTLPESERLRFLCDRDRIRLELRMNPRADQEVVRDKSRVATLVDEAGLPGAEILAITGRGDNGTLAHPTVENVAELRRLLAEDRRDGIACKPVHGMAGEDVLVFLTAGASGLVHADGTAWSVEHLWQTMIRPTRLARERNQVIAWQIERRTPPHPALEAVHGSTLGCVRVVTMRFADGSIGFLTPTWKIPVGGAGVDNLNFGSLTAAVDIDTGVVGRPILQRTMVRHDRHPLTGAGLTGMVLPDWPGPLDLAHEAMRLFPSLRSLGFDIGLTRDGPRIVEVNPYWGIQMMQAPQGRGVIQGEFLRFLEELGAEDVIRRRQRGIG